MPEKKYTSYASRATNTGLFIALMGAAVGAQTCVNRFTGLDPNDTFRDALEQAASIDAGLLLPCGLLSYGVARCVQDAQAPHRTSTNG